MKEPIYDWGHTLTTGSPITIDYLRNLEKSPYMGERYAQHIEPRGEYMNFNSRPQKDVPEYGKFETGQITFSNPLVIEHKTTAIGGWKTDLSNMFNGKTGKALSDAIKTAGYDGIITTEVEKVSGKTIASEIVNLSGVKIAPPVAAKVPVVRKAAIPLDADGGELVDLDGIPMGLNPDGTVTLYHRTSPEKATEIAKTGNFKSLENTNETFFSNKLEGQAEGYGNAVITVKAKPSDTRINDAFHNGEIHVAVSNKKLSKANIVTTNKDCPGGLREILRDAGYSDKQISKVIQCACSKEE